MSKKANLITLRTNNINNKPLIIDEKNSKNFIKTFQFLKIFIYFLQKNGIWVFKSLLYNNTNTCKIFLTLFISTKLIKLYKKELKKKSLPSQKISSIFLKQLNFLKIFKSFLQRSNYYLKIINLNNQLNKQILEYFYYKIIKYKNSLFQRRLIFYFDVIKIITLFYLKKIHTASFLLILSTIFKFLSKKLHTKFLIFLETIVYSLIYNPIKEDRRAKNSLGTLKGIKIKINGKLKGKMRASSYLIQYGKVPNQSIDANIEYAMIHTHTRYGVFGIQIWANK